MTQHFPYALGMSLTRRTFYAGDSLTAQHLRAYAGATVG